MTESAKRYGRCLSRELPVGLERPSRVRIVKNQTIESRKITNTKPETGERGSGEENSDRGRWSVRGGSQAGEWRVRGGMGCPDPGAKIGKFLSSRAIVKLAVNK